MIVFTASSKVLGIAGRVEYDAPITPMPNLYRGAAVSIQRVFQDPAIARVSYDSADERVRVLYKTPIPMSERHCRERTVRNMLGLG